MEIPAVQSLTGLQADVYSRGDKLDIVYANGFNAVQARTMLTNYVVDNTCDWVLWLDSDHVYKASAMYSLIDRCVKDNLNMLSATYYVRGAGKQTAHTRFDIAKGHFKQDELTGDVMEADVIGFGFLIMRWDFLKKIHEKYNGELFLMDHTNNTTEDVYFCRKVKDFGDKVLFDSGVIVGHLTTVVNK